jgi:hypothetical protein
MAIVVFARLKTMGQAHAVSSSEERSLETTMTMNNYISYIVPAFGCCHLS